MGMEIKSIAINQSLTELLQSCDLPISDISPSQSLCFFGCHIDAELVGAVGLEIYGAVALLRSLAVHPHSRNSGIGRALVAYAENAASSLRVESLFLLTTTAAPFFASFGYLPMPRDEAPAAIKATAQFSGLCPASSSFMSKHLSL